MAHVLVVEDDPEINALMTLMLRVENYEVEQARDGQQALQMVLQRAPDLILLDVMMPRLSGYEVAHVLQQNEATKNIPLIFVTAKSDTQDLVRGLEMAIDYVCKPFSAPELIARVRAALRMSTLQEQLRASNEKLAQLATTDALTGLCNRRHFYLELEDEIQRARRFGQPISVVMFDLDYFKTINDVWGHAQGDLVLQAFSEVLKSAKRSIDTVARLGGEEFVALLPATGFDGALAFAEKVRFATEQIRISNSTFHEKNLDDLQVTVSVGVAVATHLESQIETVQGNFAAANTIDEAARSATVSLGEPAMAAGEKRDEIMPKRAHKAVSVSGAKPNTVQNVALATVKNTPQRAHDLQYADAKLSAAGRLFLEFADRLLYRSKESGRNCITVETIFDAPVTIDDSTSTPDVFLFFEIARV